MLAKEIWPEDGIFSLSADQSIIQEEIRRSRKDERAWPRIQYLWELHPVMEWVNDKVLAAFGRHEAPVVTLHETLSPGEVIFILSGLIPNQKSQPIIHRWMGVVFHGERFRDVEDFESIVSRTHLGQAPIPNRREPVDIDTLRRRLPTVVEKARSWMRERFHEFSVRMKERLDRSLKSLDSLRQRQYAHLESQFRDSRLSERLLNDKKATILREIDRIFDSHVEWVTDTLTLEDRTYIKVIAVLKGAE